MLEPDPAITPRTKPGPHAPGAPEPDPAITPQTKPVQEPPTGSSDRGSQQVVSAQDSDEKRSKPRPKRYRKTIVLLIIFVATVAIAFFVYPRHATVYRPQPFKVTFYIDEKVASLNISVLKQPSGEYTLGIDIATDAQKSADNARFAVVSLELPTPVTSDSCKKYSCSSTLDNSSLFPGREYVTYTADFSKQAPGKQFWIAHKLFTINAPVFAWNENGLDVEGQLPSVQLLNSHGGKSSNNPSVQILYTLSDASYDWTGGPSPEYTHVFSTDSPHGVEASWNLPVTELNNPTPVSGQDNSAIAWDNLRIFVAGALVGIAGGAFVGAIQEAIT